MSALDAPGPRQRQVDDDIAQGSSFTALLGLLVPGQALLGLERRGEMAGVQALVEGKRGGLAARLER